MSENCISGKCSSANYISIFVKVFKNPPKSTYLWIASKKKKTNTCTCNVGEIESLFCHGFCIGGLLSEWRVSYTRVTSLFGYLLYRWTINELSFDLICLLLIRNLRPFTLRSTFHWLFIRRRRRISFAPI